MSKINPESPAYPRPASQYERSDGATVTDEAESGISIRALIAKDLLAALISCPHKLKMDGQDVDIKNDVLITMALGLTDNLIDRINK